MKRIFPVVVLSLSTLAWGAPQDEPLVLVSRAVDLRLEENFGVLQVQFKVKNPTDKALEGEVRFSVPEGAAVFEASLLKHISSTERKSKLVPPDQASAFYVLAKNSVKDTAEEALIAQAMMKKYPKAYYDTRKDPAIIEYAGEDKYRLRFFPVPAKDNQTVTYRVAFEVPKAEGGCVATVPLTWDSPIKTAPDAVLETRVTVRSAEDLGAVASSSHRLGSIQRHSELHRFSAAVEAGAEGSDLVLSYVLSPKARLHSFASDAKLEAALAAQRPDDARALHAVRAKRALERASEADRPSLGLAAAVVSPHASLLVIETAEARDLARTDDRAFKADAGSSRPISEEDALQCDFIRDAAQLPALAPGATCSLHVLSTNSAAKVQWAKEHGLKVTSTGVLLATRSVEYVKHLGACTLKEPNPEKLRKVAEVLK
jgi:hypothetical protein